MPYIDKESRVFWDNQMASLENAIHEDVDAGKMNYIITKLLKKWVNNKLKYVKICMVMGTLICIMFEFYRRVAAPYEDTKIKENSDVY